MCVFLCKYNNFILFKRFFVKKKLSTLFYPPQPIVFECSMGVHLLGMEGVFYAVCKGVFGGQLCAAQCIIQRHFPAGVDSP